MATLRSPAPDPVSMGNPCQAVSLGGQHQVTIWQTGVRGQGGEIHFIGTYGGASDGYDSTPYYIHHINMTSGIVHLVAGGRGVPKPIRDPNTERIYIRGHYIGSFGYFTPSSGLYTSIKNDFSYGVTSIVLSDEGSVFVYEYPATLYRYKDALGLVSVGSIGNPSDANYSALGADSTHVYLGIPKTETYNGHLWWTLKIGAIGAAYDAYSEWEFSAEHDYNLAIVFAWNSVSGQADRILLRTLVDGSSINHYKLSNGTYTTITSEGNPEYSWSGLNIVQIDKQDQLAYPFCLNQGSPNNSAWEEYGYNNDVTWLPPIPGSQEYSKVGYKLVGAESYTYSQQSYTTPWMYFAPSSLVHKTGKNIFLLTSDYSIATNFDYAVPNETGLGYHQHSNYDAIKLPSGLIYYSGYSDKVARYNPVIDWTLNSSNNLEYNYGDINAPNPYYLNLTQRYTLHYRFSLDYDANGLLWGGGNATRTLANPGAGEVWWYNPSDGTSGEIFDGTGGKPDWANSEVYFRNLCLAVSRSKIVVASNNGFLTVIDAATKAIDGTYNLAADTGTPGDYAYMVEVSNDAVLGITPTGYKFLFKPSDRTMTIAVTSIGVSGTPFGWDNTQYERMNYKLELGPDNYAWLFIGTRLYRVDSSLNLYLIKSFDTYRKLKFIDTAGDQTNYDLILYGNGSSLSYLPSIFYTPESGEPMIGPSFSNNREVCGSGNVRTMCGVNFNQVCGITL